MSKLNVKYRAGGLISGKPKEIPELTIYGKRPVKKMSDLNVSSNTESEFDAITRRYGPVRFTSEAKAGSNAMPKRIYIEARKKDGSFKYFSPEEFKKIYSNINIDHLTTLKDGGMVKKNRSSKINNNILSKLNNKANGGMIESPYDWRTDPLADKTRKRDLRKASGTSIMGDVGSMTSIGGAIGGPLGAAIGAGAGVLTGIVKKLGANKRANEQLENESRLWKEELGKHYQGVHSSMGYKKGGKVKGKGTGKSDDIPMKAEEGSFVVPSENRESAMNIGREYLGWDEDTLAKRNYGQSGENINVSNGEVIFTPTEVGLLDYYGIDYKSMAPNAEEKVNMQDGGDVKKKTVEYSPEKAIPDTMPKTNPYLQSKKEVMDRFNKAQNKQSVLDYIPEIAGSLQMLGGAYGLIREGASPTMQVSDTLKKLSSEVRQMANYGYEPKVINALNKSIENTYKDMSNVITGRGGSPMEIMSKLQTLLGTTMDKKAEVIYTDAAEKARKYTDVVRVDMAKAGQEFDASRLNLEDYYKKQEAYGSLLSTGITNTIGARKYKATLDAFKKTGNTNLTIQ